MIVSELRVVCRECRRPRTELFNLPPTHGERTVIWYAVRATDTEYQLLGKPCPACGEIDLLLVFTSRDENDDH